MQQIISPANLSLNEVENIARSFAQKTGFEARNTDIFDYVKTTLNGNIEYQDINLDKAGGAIAVRAKDDFTIYLSRITPVCRDVFTVAHELGHYVLHSRLGAIPMLANRDSNKDDAEKEANSFAAAFLMPSELIEDEFKKNNDVYKLADIFKVSYSAMKWRCKNLGYKVDER